MDWKDALKAMFVDAPAPEMTRQSAYPVMLDVLTAAAAEIKPHHQYRWWFINPTISGHTWTFPVQSTLNVNQ